MNDRDQTTAHQCTCRDCSPGTCDKGGSDHCKTCWERPQTTKRRCASCGEVFDRPHNCDKAREARALFEAAKRANDPDSRRALGNLALQAAEDAESV